MPSLALPSRINQPILEENVTVNISAALSMQRNTERTQEMAATHASGCVLDTRFHMHT